MPRYYLRHPTEIPIFLNMAEPPQTVKEGGRDYSAGGLSCISDLFITPGSAVHITLSLSHPDLIVSGHVIWCHRQPAGYLIGIGFDDPDQVYTVRMIEQICQIESFRLKQKRNGRQLSSEQAAVEWIALHAAGFPTCEQLQ
ncbi:PilZ domain-containing protein [Amphritea japonica]|uniref:PilZ domain-containing protein n=1 Tax=Amphritea japonica ATCC BAA-1530 TaxID=1278309 RepID=A0A7R6PCG9_9GAMM|nr:PilZ domain-containing protein [Amphritea japonica]BBB26858.1 conserved hypothetical protein [Amphritea japonica ATCC BAA-1530]